MTTRQAQQAQTASARENSEAGETGKRDDEAGRKDDMKVADDIANLLTPRLLKSPALEAAIAFPDPDLLAKLPMKDLAELEIGRSDSFCLFVVTEADGCYFDLVYSFNPVLELAEDIGWFPSIEVFTAAQAKEAGGLEQLAKSWSPLVHSIFRREPCAA